jgi:glutaminyl-peptide cyclotransferase
MRARWWLPLIAPVLLAASCGGPDRPDGARALERVRRQVAFGPRVPGSAAHGAMRAWLGAELERLGGRVENQAFRDTVAGAEWPLENLIARWGPQGGRRIALFAHYDSRPWCDEDPDPAKRGSALPGANDGASGVAVLLEVAEAMHARAPAVGVDLVFLDGEDLGRPTSADEYCRGSRGYARRLPASGDAARPVAAFVFDMVGDRDLGIWDEGNSAARATNLVELVHEAARASGARHFHEGVRHTLIDDHVPLLDAGLPAVDIIDFDYEAWHTTADTPDQVSAESLAEVSRVALWLVYRSALARP